MIRMVIYIKLLIAKTNQTNNYDYIIIIKLNIVIYHYYSNKLYKTSSTLCKLSY
jgi:hypothetical protein